MNACQLERKEQIFKKNERLNEGMASQKKERRNVWMNERTKEKLTDWKRIRVWKKRMSVK